MDQVVMQQHPETKVILTDFRNCVFFLLYNVRSANNIVSKANRQFKCHLYMLLNFSVIFFGTQIVAF